jgi:hypothetical protein
MPNTPAIVQHPLVREILGDTPLSLFGLMHIAETEISSARLRHDASKADAINTVFRALQPSPILRGKTDMLYRAHARELCDRAAAGVSFRPATDAEILAALMDTALKSPLRSEALALAEHLMASIFPAQSAALGEPLGRVQYKGQLTEMLAEARRQLSQDR